MSNEATPTPSANDNAARKKRRPTTKRKRRFVVRVGYGPECGFWMLVGGGCVYGWLSTRTIARRVAKFLNEETP